MRTLSLQSGSNGNCIYVEAGDVRLLFDAGISGLQAERRLADRGRDIRGCHALIISHNHSDHCRSAGVFHRKFGLPVYMTGPAYRSVRKYLGAVREVRQYAAGESLRFGGVTVHTLRTPHDGLETACFIIEHEGRRLGVLTDLGYPFPALADALSQLDAAFLESNYDRAMLWDGPYPEHLKHRIAGAGGHLSNEEAATLVRNHANGRLKWLAIAHLSEENNRPELALAAHRARVGRLLPLHHASRYEAGEWLEV